MRKSKVLIPHEDIEQGLLFEWTQYQIARFPELALLFHIPNEAGTRTFKETVRLKELGVKAGVPDLFLPVARWGWHGLFIEMKRQRNGHVSEVQKEWISALVEQGYLVRVCHGFDEAKKTLLLYLTGSIKKGVRTDDA